jgi:hypothetical protein
MPAWTATWAINEIPGGCEVIRDGRPVGIGTCDDMDEALKRIRRHRFYDPRDQVVRRQGGRDRDVNVGT